MEPITRTEKLMAGQQLEPITRKELFLAKAAGMDVKTPEPITREEMFLNMITGGGGGSSVPWNDVTFIDYDGTVLHSYTLEEAQALTELPPLPEQKGLICQGWNWSLEDIKAQNGPVIVGAMYITDDGKTRIYITLQEGRTSPVLGVNVSLNGTVTVDWGDGTEPDVLTGGSYAYNFKQTPPHEYAKAGDYVISLSVDGDMYFHGDMTSCSYMLGAGSIGRSENFPYLDAVKKIEIGNGVTKLHNYAFYKCRNLKTVVIPNGVTEAGSYPFMHCCELKSIVIPTAFTQKPNTRYCVSLESISIPANVLSSLEMFMDLYSLEHATLNNGMTTLNKYVFMDCYKLSTIVIPSSVTTIESQAFYGCSSMRCYDFSACTSVPTLGNTNAFSDSYKGCQMLIPSALFDEWSTATNWATYASYMVAV